MATVVMIPSRCDGGDNSSGRVDGTEMMVMLGCCRFVGPLNRHSLPTYVLYLISCE